MPGTVELRKYTDALLALTFRQMGFDCKVLTERADAPDVDCISEGYSFVADAKAFRISRTANPQKDFKAEAMAGWKRGRSHAAVVCPIYHLPAKSSQIYMQAGTRNVAILSYSHLAIMYRFAKASGTEKAKMMLFKIFEVVEQMHASSSKDATIYWRAVNAAMSDECSAFPRLKKEEEEATFEAINALQKEALAYLDAERATIEEMSREEAIAKLLRGQNIPGRVKMVGAVSGKSIFEL